MKRFKTFFCAAPFRLFLKGSIGGDGALSPFEKNPTCLRIPASSAAATGG